MYVSRPIFLHKGNADNIFGCIPALLTTHLPHHWLHIQATHLSAPILHRWLRQCQPLSASQNKNPHLKRGGDFYLISGVITHRECLHCH